MNTQPVFRIPTRPYSIVDAYNRAAASHGSPRYAKGASHADYNGHHVAVRWNSFRGYYTADYWWAGRNVLARGSLATCMRAAIDFYDRGALGAAVTIAPRPEDAALCEAEPRLQTGPDDLSWCTWRHREAARCAPDAASRSPRMIFDLELLTASNSEDEYHAALRAKYGTALR